MSGTPGAGQTGGADHGRAVVGEVALRARKAAIWGKRFGIVSAISAALIVAGVLLIGHTSDPLDYLLLVILAVFPILPLGVLGLVLGSYALFRAIRAETSKTDAIQAIVLSGFGTAVGLSMRLWAETF